jgi:hypothetical protein
MNRTLQKSIWYDSGEKNAPEDCTETIVHRLNMEELKSAMTEKKKTPSLDGVNIHLLAKNSLTNSVHC